MYKIQGQNVVSIYRFIIKVNHSLIMGKYLQNPEPQCCKYLQIYQQSESQLNNHGKVSTFFLLNQSESQLNYGKVSTKFRATC